MLRENLVAERIVIESYQEIIRWLGDGDVTTRRLMEDIGLGPLVVGVDEVADGGLEVGDGGEGGAADGLAGDDAEEDLDHVQPRTTGRGEVQGDPWVLRQPGADVLVVVGAVDAPMFVKPLLPGRRRCGVSVGEQLIEHDADH
jgi:hypothetical protein